MAKVLTCDKCKLIIPEEQHTEAEGFITVWVDTDQVTLDVCEDCQQEVVKFVSPKLFKKYFKGAK